MRSFRVSLASLVVPCLLAASLPLQAGCARTGRVAYATTDARLALTRVVLYRNGVGYFERTGRVEGDRLILKVRKDQVNDLLKSLTVVDRATGKALSVSMPLDPQTWANRAIQKLAPGSGSLHEVLDALRGADVSLTTTDGGASGRIVMVERLERADGGLVVNTQAGTSEAGPELDYKVTLLEGTALRVVRLSTVKAVSFQDGDLALQLHRSLDASAGEGMFEQVEVTIRLAGPSSHDLSVSYVVAAPIWKPTYRIVLPEGGTGKALLQGWAVVDNTSSEDWSDVQLSLTSGSPIAFQYDLHSPRDIVRTDLSATGSVKQARAAVGEASWGPMPPPPPPPPPAPPSSRSVSGEEDEDAWGGVAMGGAAPKPADKRERVRRAPAKASSAPAGQAGYFPAETTPWAPPAAVDLSLLQSSVTANTQARAVSGLVQFDLGDRVSLPDGSSTMVAVVNQEVGGEETFLFKPGGAGQGFETNPYRVVRFQNTTPFALESGPISIYAGGSFVGEGISDAVSAGSSATIPFAVEPNIFVSSTSNYGEDEVRLVKLVRGVLETERFQLRTTTWSVRVEGRKEATTLLVRQSKAGSAYTLQPRPDGAEDLPDAYLVPLKLAAGVTEGKLEVVERTPVRRSLSIWDSSAPKVLEGLIATNLPADLRAKLQPVVDKRVEIGRIDTKIDGLRRQQAELDARAEQTRSDLRAIEKDTAAAAQRKKLTERLESFSKDAAKLGREIVELNTKRVDLKVQLEDLLQNLELTAPDKK